MSKEKSTDTFARVISIVSLMIAILAVAIPYYQSEKQLEEEIILSLSENYEKGDDLKLIGGKMFGDMGVIQLPHTFSISNNGNRTSSITEMITAMVDIDGSEKRFSKLHGDMFRNGNKVSLPINIESGQSNAYTLYLGALVDNEVYLVLDSMKTKQNTVDCKIAKMALGRNGIDIFNNSIRYKEYDKESYIITSNPNEQKSPTYVIYNKTSRGEESTTKFSKYDRER